MEKKHLIFSKTLSIILSLIMLFSALQLTVIGFAEEKTSYAVGDTIEYGSYPQTEVTDTSVIAQLEALAGSTDNWTSYNYYSSQNTVGDYMKYTDVTYNGEKYRGVYFSLYRPNWTTSTASTSVSTYQDDNLYTYGNTYWFKFEPIEWVILEAGTGGLAVCKNILDSQAYCDTYYGSDPYYSDSDSTYYCNNWEHSTIRTWLNSTFINTAFTTSQQNNIVETTIETPAYSTSYSQYDSADTRDKVFLLSYTDVQNTAYGFVSGTSGSKTRQKTGTDYAKSQGLYVNSSNKCSYWRLRAAGDFSHRECGVYIDGSVYYNFNTYNTSNGVVAALYFQSYNSAGTSDCVHSYKSTVTAPTCTEKGFTTHTCTKCGDSYVDTYTEALGHNFSSETQTSDYLKSSATCTSGNIYYYKCTRCTAKGTATYETGSALGHVWGIGEITTPATYTAPGVMTYTCENCDATMTEEIPILVCEHEFEETYVVVDGEERVSSSIDIAFVIDTTGSMGDDIAQVKSDIDTYLKTLADNDIDYRIALVDYRDFASRTNDSRDYAYQICLDFTDDALAISNAVNALSLGNGGDNEETVYSALTDGLKGLSWRDDAGKTAILMGDYGALDPEPETGYTLSSVTDVLKTEFSSPVTVFGIATGSSALSSFTKIAEATGGKAYSAASSLNITSLVTTIIKIMPTVIVVPGAKWQIRTAATCTEPGVEFRVCVKCKIYEQTRAIEPLGHSYGSWNSNNNGTHSKTCSVCYNTDTANCTYTDTVTPATASQQGYTTHTCTVCGYSYNDTYTDPSESTEVYDETVVLFNSGNTSSAGCHYYGKSSGWISTSTPNFDAASKTNGGYDIYANHNYSPVTQVGTSFTVKSDITEDAKLNLNCYDVDENSGERDYLYLVDETDNKEYKLSGYLSGMNEEWNSTSFIVPAEYLIKNHTYHLKLNVAVAGWHVFVRTAEIELTGWTSPLAGAELSADISGNTVSTSLYVKTLETAGLTLEYKAVCGMQQYGSAFATVTGTTSGVTLPVDIELESGAPSGTYQITAYIKETATGNPLNSVTATVSKGSKYSVNYHSNGGTNNVPTDAAAYESGATVNVLFTDIPSRTGYTFMGWATSASASTPAYTSKGTKTFTMGSKDVELYAVWSDTACSHSYSATVTTPATCTTPGVMTYTCIYCGYSYTESISSEHNYELYDTVPATCTVDGKKIYKCTNCGDTYEEVITGGHNYVPEITKKATETEPGIITYVCSKCGDFYTEEYTIKSGDILLVQDIPSWQTSSDTDLLTQLKADGKITEWDKVSSAALMTMDISGYDVIMIANDQVESTYTNLAACNNMLTQFVSDGGVVIYGACDNGWVDGDISYALPGGVIKKNYYSHNNYILDYTSPVVTGKLSDGTGITNAILEGNFCSHSYFEASSLSEDAHIILADGNGNATLAEYTIGKGRVIVSGLTWEFYYERDYSNFEKTYSENVYDDLVLYAMSCCYYVECNHNEKTETQAATCIEDGYVRTVCTVCKKTLSEEIIPALGHDASGDYVVAKKATCTEDGNKALYCSRCGFELVADVIIPAKGHNWGEWTTVTAVTCTTDGENVRYCQNEADDCYEKCSESEKEIIEATDHTPGEWEITKAATCTTAGTKVKKCTVCKTVLATETIKATGHKLGSWIKEQAPTCTKTGVKGHYTCSVCKKNFDSNKNEISDLTIGKTAHTYGEWQIVQTATCQVNGVMKKYCTVCGTELDSKLLDKEDHKDDNGDGYCDWCGLDLNPEAHCSHLCHKSGILGFFWKIINLFNRLFKINQYCECGAKHW